MGFLDTLFRGKETVESIPMTLNVYDSGFNLNGTDLTFPVRVSDLTKILGEPRVNDRIYPEQLRRAYCKEHSIRPECFTGRDYYWDNIGLLACTFESKTVHCLIIYMRKSKYPMPMPKCSFSGTFLINGKPWQERCLKHGIGNVVPLGKLHMYIIRYGREISEKAVVQFQISLNSKEKLTFFN